MALGAHCTSVTFFTFLTLFTFSTSVSLFAFSAGIAFVTFLSLLAGVAFGTLWASRTDDTVGITLLALVTLLSLWTSWALRAGRALGTCRAGIALWPGRTVFTIRPITAIGSTLPCVHTVFTIFTSSSGLTSVALVTFLALVAFVTPQLRKRDDILPITIHKLPLHLAIALA